jgi:DNA-3-methyladenine glycosylase II
MTPAITSEQTTTRADEIRRGLAHLRAADPVLAALIDRRPDYDPDAWRRELPVMDLFGCLVFQITGQQISMKAAQAILHRLTELFDGRLPTPADVVELDEKTLRGLGLSWRKARTVLDLAGRFVDGRLSQQRLSQLPDDDVLAELTQVPGIGPWTVHGALLISLRRDDVVPTGDIMLRKAVRRYYALDHLPTESEFEDIARAWHPYGSLGVNLLFAAVELDTVPTTRPNEVAE